MAAIGWSLGRSTGNGNEMYRPVPPLGVVYEVIDRELHVIRIIDGRRRLRLP